MSMRLSILLIALWLSIAFVWGFYEVSLLLPFWGPPLVPLILCFLFYNVYDYSVPIKTFINSLSIRVLVYPLLVRALVLYFIVLYAQNKFPGSFVFPAVGGAIIFLFFAAYLIINPAKLNSRPWILAFNYLGIMQLISVILIVAGHIVFGAGKQISSFGILPLNLFPTFIVPFSLLVHIIIHKRIKLV